MNFDQNKAEEEINSRVRSLCPNCNGNKWTLATKIWKISEYKTGKDILPVVSLICDTCGHIIFFNAITMGLVEKE